MPTTNRSERERPPTAAGARAVVAVARGLEPGPGTGPSWDALVEHYTPMLRSIARSTGLGPADAADVCQTTWLRLVQHIDNLEHPDRVGAWLATAVRREAIRVSQRRRRDVLIEETEVFDRRRRHVEPRGDWDDSTWDDSTASDDRRRALVDAVATLPERSQALMTLLLADPPPPYADISSRLDIPVGSIGPTRARILTRLRTTLEDQGIDRTDVPVG